MENYFKQNVVSKCFQQHFFLNKTKNCLFYCNKAVLQGSNLIFLRSLDLEFRHIQTLLFKIQGGFFDSSPPKCLSMELALPQPVCQGGSMAQIFVNHGLKSLQYHEEASLKVPGLCKCRNKSRTQCPFSTLPILLEIKFY